MTASSRYTRAISSEVGDIERRLRILQNGIEKLGTRASSNDRDTVWAKPLRRLCRAGRIAFAKAQTRSASNPRLLVKMRPAMGPQP